MAIQLIWYKRDLRVSDHLPLTCAATSGPCIALYVYEPELIEADDSDAAHLDFVNQSIAELRSNLRRLGSDLFIRAGQMPDVLEGIHDKFDIAKIWAHEETFNNISYQRDQRVRAWAKAKHIPIVELPQFGVVRRLTDRNGWAAKWNQRMTQPLTDPPSRIESPESIADCDRGNIRNADQFKVNSFKRTNIQTGGESKAIEYLDSFLNSRGANYRGEMSSPVTADVSCSRLSSYIAYGNISMRTIHHRTNSRIKEIKELKKQGTPLDSTWLQSLSSFKSRLSWHCHFMQKMEDEPSIEFQNMNRAYDGLREDQFNDEYFDAWCQGQTGYPLVDACMRALHQTGWINFRMRAMLVSFASYHLWLHWRKPATYLARLFLDYEPGIHYSQIQMQSGVTGINTVRIYSPIKQVADQDPQGIFIRKYVPELADIPDKHLAEPHQMNAMEQTFYGCKIGVDYPKPIVDHLTQYKMARDRIHQIKKAPQTRAESNKVYLKHGSRKTPMSKR